MTAPYAKRILSFVFQLGEGSFGQSGFNKLVVSGLRAVVAISQAQTPTPSNAIIRIFGLTADQINTLTRAGYAFQSRANYVAVQAGDATSGLTTVYNGTIIEAYPDFKSQPSVSFVIITNAASVIQLQPVSPVTFPGSVAASTALTQILKPVGITVENNGVNAMLASPYFQGTAWQQAIACCKAAGVFSHFDAVSRVWAIWPKSGMRAGESVTIAPQSQGGGMIDYPEFMQNRIKIRNIFDPTIKGPGLPITVNSSLKSANNKWVLDQIDYDLSCEMPGGPWEMALIAHPAGTPQ
jgi:hypothetical protein